MGNFTDALFGGSEQKSTSGNVSGFGALPGDIQDQYRSFLDAAQPLLSDPSQFYAPIGLTPEELTAQMMIQPESFAQNISTYLNPYRDIITQDINRQFEDQFSAFNQAADVAGAFGGSGYDTGLADIERARSDSIARAMADQYGMAADLAQQGIGNLLGFGGLERGIELAASMALPQGLAAYGDIIGPLLGGSEGSTVSRGSTQPGIIPVLFG